MGEPSIYAMLEIPSSAMRHRVPILRSIHIWHFYLVTENFNIIYVFHIFNSGCLDDDFSCLAFSVGGKKALVDMT